MPKLSSIIFPVYRIIPAVCKQVGIGEVAVGAEIGGIIRIDKAADFRIIIAVGQVVESGLGISESP